MSEEGLSLIKRIEFHEGKSKNLRIPYIETRFYVSDLKAFIKWCAGENWDKWVEGTFEFNVKRKEKSKSERPVFNMFIKSKEVFIYPRENMIAIRDAGLHYICQHSFDILSRKVFDLIYDYSNIFNLGYLYTLNNEKFLVKNKDIRDGFMLTREGIAKFNDSFSNWIRWRRKEEEK